MSKKCPVCCRLFKDAITLNLHFEQSHDSGDAVCEFCGDACDDPRFRKRVGCQTTAAPPAAEWRAAGESFVFEDAAVDVHASTRASSSVSAPLMNPNTAAPTALATKHRFPPTANRAKSDRNKVDVDVGQKRRLEPSADILELVKNKYPKILPKFSLGVASTSNELHKSDVGSGSSAPIALKLNADNDLNVDVAEVEVSTCERVESVGVSLMPMLSTEREVELSTNVSPTAQQLTPMDVEIVDRNLAVEADDDSDDRDEQPPRLEKIIPCRSKTRSAAKPRRLPELTEKTSSSKERKIAPAAGKPLPSNFPGADVGYKSSASSMANNTVVVLTTGGVGQQQPVIIVNRGETQRQLQARSGFIMLAFPR